MPDPGDVILAKVQFTDTYEMKRRPALVLYEEYGNVIVAGVTSNLNMKGVSLSKKDGAIKQSVIKLNYIFTISERMLEKTLFHLPTEKKKEIFDGMVRKLGGLR